MYSHSYPPSLYVGVSRLGLETGSQSRDAPQKGNQLLWYDVVHVSMEFVVANSLYKVHDYG